jgi:hypothetical protein
MKVKETKCVFKNRNKWKVSLPIRMRIGRDVIYVMLKFSSNRDDFRSIHTLSSDMGRAQVLWKDNWITFIDGVLQTCTLRENFAGISQPNFMKKMIVDIKAQLNERVNSDTEGLLKASYNKTFNRTRFGIIIYLFNDKDRSKWKEVISAYPNGK